MKITSEAYAIRNKIIERDLHELKGLNPEQVQTIVDLLKEIQVQREQMASRWSEGLEYGTRAIGKLVRPLLTIELDDETSVPKVIYKGEELTGKKKVNLEWETRREHPGTGGLIFEIEHFDKETESLHIVGRRNGEYL